MPEQQFEQELGVAQGQLGAERRKIGTSIRIWTHQPAMLMDFKISWCWFGGGVSKSGFGWDLGTLDKEGASIDQKTGEGGE